MTHPDPGNLNAPSAPHAGSELYSAPARIPQRAAMNPLRNTRTVNVYMSTHVTLYAQNIRRA